ncbi:MAG: VPLPA-CTERM sorting domain-containing protein [Gammaproteobacteria bacterium]
MKRTQNRIRPLTHGAGALLLALWMGVLLPGVGQAAIPGIEDHVFFTRDTVHGLDFLDVNLFVDRTWTQLEDGVDYAGRHWDLATVEQITDIWRLAQPLVPSGVGQYAAPDVNDPFITELVSLFGSTAPAGGSYAFVNGWTGSQASALPEEYYTALLWDYFVMVAPVGDLYRTSASAGPGLQSPTIGAWLVSPVPLPASAWLLLPGVAVSAFGRRRTRGTNAPAHCQDASH